MSGSSSTTATARPGGRPRPDSRQVAPASCETSERRLRVDDRDHGRAGGRRGDEPRQVERRRGRRRRTARRPRLDLVGLEVDRERARGRGDERDHRASSDATTAVARRAAPAGAKPALRADDVRGRERVAGAGRIARRSARAGTSRACRRVDGRAARAVRDEHLAHAERRGVAEHLCLLVGELQHPDVPQQLAVEVVVELAAARPRGTRTSPCPSRRRGGARERGERLGRELVREQRRDVHPARRSERRAGRSGCQVSPSASTRISARSPS